MNLRKMTYVPNERAKKMIAWGNDQHVVWQGHTYNVIIDEEDQFEMDCRFCDANRHRIKEPGFMNGGMCPDSDPNLDWVCCGPNGETKVLRSR